MMDLEKAIERVEVEFATVRQACLGQQKALDDATFALTMAAHDAGLLPHAYSHFNPDAWAEVISLAANALRARRRETGRTSDHLIRHYAAKLGYSILGVEWLTRREVDLAARKDGDPVIRVFHLRAGDHTPPDGITSALCDDLRRQAAIDATSAR